MVFPRVTDGTWTSACITSVCSRRLRGGQQRKGNCGVHDDVEHSQEPLSISPLLHTLLDDEDTRQKTASQQWEGSFPIGNRSWQRSATLVGSQFGLPGVDPPPLLAILNEQHMQLHRARGLIGRGMEPPPSDLPRSVLLPPLRSQPWRTTSSAAFSASLMSESETPGLQQHKMKATKTRCNRTRGCENS